MRKFKGWKVPFVVAFSVLTAATYLVAQSNNSSDGLQYIPRDALLVLRVNPQSMKEGKVSRELKPVLDEYPLWIRGVKGADVQQLWVAVLAGEREPEFVAKTVLTPQGMRAAVASMQKTMQDAGDGKTFTGPGRMFNAYRIVDGNTILHANNPMTLSRILQTGDASDAVWASTILRSDAPVVAVANGSLLRGNPMLNREMSRGIAQEGLPFGIMDLWRKTEHVTLELKDNTDLEVWFRTLSASEFEAEMVETAARDAVSLGRNLLSQLRGSVSQMNSSELMQLVDIADRALERASIQRRGKLVAGVAKVSGASGSLLESVRNALTAAGRASAVAAETNNLKQVALAMHNYESAYRKFPASVQMGPDNQPRSWRVTVLPFIEGGELYQRYKQEQPWNSPENSALIGEIPSVYQDPDAEVGMTNIKCFTGPGAAYEVGKNMRFGELTDGSSNTLMAALSPNPVTWTKPEDIAIEPGQPLPAWTNGQFTAALMDGSVRTFAPGTDPEVIRQMVNRADGLPLPERRR